MQNYKLIIFILIGVVCLSASSVYAETAEEYFTHGCVSYNQGNLPQAIANYTKAIAIKPDYAAAYNNRGLVYFRLHNFIQAIADYTKAIALDPNFAAAYNNRGQANHNLGTLYGNQRNFVQAIADYNKAIDLDPNYALAYYNRGFTYFMIKDYGQAWLDVYEAEGLGATINPEFLAALKEASGRDK
ncbi:MAG: tetratricopeptide repeat protein [Candidatus Omnitrophota bacterium]